MSPSEQEVVRGHRGGVPMTFLSCAWVVRWVGVGSSCMASSWGMQRVFDGMVELFPWGVGEVGREVGSSKRRDDTWSGDEAVEEGVVAGGIVEAE